MTYTRTHRERQKHRFFFSCEILFSSRSEVFIFESDVKFANHLKKKQHTLHIDTTAMSHRRC